MSMSVAALSAEFGKTRPFGGLTIGTGIHLEAKTVALLLTLRVDATSCVVPVPGHIDAAIAGSYLDRKYPAV